MKQSIENEIKNHNLEKSELMNKVTALAEQGKLARVRFKNLLISLNFRFITLVFIIENALLFF